MSHEHRSEGQPRIAVELQPESRPVPRPSHPVSCLGRADRLHCATGSLCAIGTQLPHAGRLRGYRLPVGELGSQLRVEPRPPFSTALGTAARQPYRSKALILLILMELTLHSPARKSGSIQPEVLSQFQNNSGLPQGRGWRLQANLARSKGEGS
jgi:hypothetical protein